MNDARGREPRGDEHGADLRQPDRRRRLENVEVLQNVREGHEAEGAQKAEACEGTECSVLGCGTTGHKVVHVHISRQHRVYVCTLGQAQISPQHEHEPQDLRREFIVRDNVV